MDTEPKTNLAASLDEPMLGESRNNKEKEEERDLVGMPSLQGIGKAVLRSQYKPPDVRTLIKSMETAAKYVRE